MPDSIIEIILIFQKLFTLKLLGTMISGIVIAKYAFYLQEKYKKKWEWKKFVMQKEHDVWSNLLELKKIKNSIEQFYNIVENIDKNGIKTVTFPEYNLNNKLNNIPVYFFKNKNKDFKELLFKINIEIKDFNKNLKELRVATLDLKKNYFNKNDNRKEMINSLKKEVEFTKSFFDNYYKVLWKELFNIYIMLLKLNGNKRKKSDIEKEILDKLNDIELVSET